MKPIARQGDLHRCPCSGHSVTPIVSGSPQSRVEGQPVARVGDKTACGATIIEGSGSATTDGQPTAYLGCKTDHGGEIISAASQAMVEP
ncbi:PAAR domain-containing protein [Halomonas organivorans]|uniref:Putative Zn-binding protein involved in type VI secretion n=1 Tax=Halomonas organivorans TaxID=257772 RepID=A0A7W5C0W3_9GAMM|nr:PAAR domain-containing protein [Halomonas organivorans]MBB3142597.1 putative Zn-binding protein involved in type VI secretion [Halomonas organivorans]